MQSKNKKIDDPDNALQKPTVLIVPKEQIKLNPHAIELKVQKKSFNNDDTLEGSTLVLQQQSLKASTLDEIIISPSIVEIKSPTIVEVQSKLPIDIKDNYDADGDKNTVADLTVAATHPSKNLSQAGSSHAIKMLRGLANQLELLQTDPKKPKPFLSGRRVNDNHSSSLTG